MEGVYASEQPLIDCGFINADLMWTQTSINTIEIVTIENCDVFAKVTKFPHDVTYLITCLQDPYTNQFSIYGGNNKGEVYIYNLEGKDKLVLQDMLILNEEAIIRNVKRVSETDIVCTTENGELKMFKYDPT